jgi:hypothetical protein
LSALLFPLCLKNRKLKYLLKLCFKEKQKIKKQNE